MNFFGENSGFTNLSCLLRGPVLLLCGLLRLAGGVACSLSTAYNLKSGRNNLFLPDNIAVLVGNNIRVPSTQTIITNTNAHAMCTG